MVPKKRCFFSLRSGVQKWVPDFVSFFRPFVFRADFAALTICFFLGGSFLVPGPAVSASPICNRLALHLGKLSRVPLFPHFAFGLRIIRVASANPFSSVAALPLFFSALRVRSSSRISFILHPARGREKVDGRSIHFLNSRGGTKHCRLSAFFFFSSHRSEIFFPTRVKILLQVGVDPTSRRKFCATRREEH